MKSKKSVITLLVAVFMILSLMTGCGGQKVHNEKQIKEDLIEQGFNVVWLNQDEHVLDISELNIDRRRTEGDYDEVYVTIKMENDTYQVDTNCTLYYTYYDEGGWYLEDCMMNDYHSAAKKSILTDENFLNYTSNYFTSCEIIERNQQTDEMGNFSEEIEFSAETKYEYWTVHFEGVYSLAFMDDIWIEDCSIVISNIDWDALLGSWKYQFDGRNDGTTANDYIYDIAVNITNITQSESDYLQVAYNGNSYSCWDTELYPSKVNVDKSFSEDNECKIEYKMEEVMGVQMAIPYQINAILVPWDERTSWYPYLKVYVDPNEGLYTEEGKLESSNSSCFLIKDK